MLSIPNLQFYFPTYIWTLFSASFNHSLTHMFALYSISTFINIFEFHPQKIALLFVHLSPSKSYNFCSAHFLCKPLKWAFIKFHNILVASTTSQKKFNSLINLEPKRDIHNPAQHKPNPLQLASSAAALCYPNKKFYSPSEKCWLYYLAELQKKKKKGAHFYHGAEKKNKRNGRNIKNERMWAKQREKPTWSDANNKTVAASFGISCLV